jgi:hypothetical protein
MNRLLVSLIAIALPLALEARAATPPYPPSSLVGDITWDFANINSAAPGSDLWPVTWAADGNLYTSWGDGGGFTGNDSRGRVSLGVARVEGAGDNWQGFNVFGGNNTEAPATFEGKVNGGIISINASLYMFVQQQDVWTHAKIGKSVDNGKTWLFNNGDFANSSWDLSEPGGAFASPGIIQFGRDYQGARDGFVYGYGHEGLNNGLALFRVPKDKVMNRGAYEFCTGVDVAGNPQWTADVRTRQAIFTDPNGVGWGYNAMHHPVLKRYLLTVRHDDVGGWGIFEAPEPWGPWRTVAYYDNWIDSQFKFTFIFNQKWMSADGKTMWMAFSGTGKYDSFNVIKATFILAGTRPLPPTGLLVQ